jgi:hypothetical protein
VKGTPETGESLDAQEWRASDNLVVVGTEDSECLASRLQFLRVERDESVMRFHPDRMEIRVDNVPADFDLSLHFVVAENVWPEPVDASAWYAADIPHEELLKLAVS